MKRLHIVVSLVVVASCGGTSDITSAPNSARATVPRIAVSGGNNQTAEVGSTLPVPVSVRVTDAANGDRPVVGQLLLWIVSKGAGRVEVDTTRTDAEGYSRQRWTLGTFATDDSLDVWMISPARQSIGYGSVAATAVHGPALAGDPQCDPVAFSLTANATIPIVDSIRVYARDRYNNVWPTATRIAVQDVHFSGHASGGVSPPASFTPSTITLAPSSKTDGVGGATSWQGGWVVTLAIDGPDHATCAIGATAQ